MTLARLSAALVAILAALGLAWQFQLNGTIATPLPPLARAWDMLRYYTNITNLLVVIVLARAALGGRVGPNLAATLTLSIIMVGVVYRLLLAPPEPKPAPDFYPDFFLHVATPVLVPLWWAAFAEHNLRLKGLIAWLSLPFAYLVYALIRGLASGRYPYFFLDLEKSGPLVVLIYSLGLIAAFAGVGVLLYLFARILPRRA
jgi:hypothetical protein